MTCSHAACYVALIAAQDRSNIMGDALKHCTCTVHITLNMQLVAAGVLHVSINTSPRQKNDTQGQVDSAVATLHDTHLPPRIHVCLTSAC